MRSPDRRSVAPVPGDEPGVTASRLFLAPLVLALLLGVVSLFAPDADAAPQRDARSARTYTVIRTFGPLNGEATWQNNLPGQLPDGEALWVACDPFDRITGHSLRVDRLGGRQVIRITSRGVEFSRYEPDDRWMFYAWPAATGKPGWNKVTLTAACKDTAAPYRG